MTNQPHIPDHSPAAILEGYEATGIEMSEEYARLAAERIETELKQAA